MITPENTPITREARDLTGELLQKRGAESPEFRDFMSKVSELRSAVAADSELKSSFDKLLADTQATLERSLTSLVEARITELVAGGSRQTLKKAIDIVDALKAVHESSTSLGSRDVTDLGSAALGGAFDLLPEIAPQRVGPKGSHIFGDAALPSPLTTELSLADLSLAEPLDSGIDLLDVTEPVVRGGSVLDDTDDELITGGADNSALVLADEVSEIGLAGESELGLGRIDDASKAEDSSSDLVLDEPVDPSIEDSALVLSDPEELAGGDAGASMLFQPEELDEEDSGPRSSFELPSMSLERPSLLELAGLDDLDDLSMFDDMDLEAEAKSEAVLDDEEEDVIAVDEPSELEIEDDEDVLARQSDIGKGKDLPPLDPEFGNGTADWDFDFSELEDQP